MSTFYLVTPSFNNARFISTAIAGIVTQYGDFSIYLHIQDGGSDDGTIRLLKQWEALLATNPPFVQCRKITFTWNSSQDTGMYDAINKGFDFLSPPGDGIMAWCNTDDVYTPGVFSTVAHAFRHNPGVRWIGGKSLGVTYGALHQCIPTNNPYPSHLLANYCCDGSAWGYVAQGTVFWKGDLWKDAGPLNTNLRFAGDFELWPRFSAHAEMAHLGLPINIFMFRDNQLSKQIPEGGQLSYYKQEEDLLCPAVKRRKTVQRFWRKRLLPPLAPALVLEKSFYVLRQRRAWPQWGLSPAEYVTRRFWYLYGIIRSKLSGVF